MIDLRIVLMTALLIGYLIAGLNLPRIEPHVVAAISNAQQALLDSVR